MSDFPSNESKPEKSHWLLHQYFSYHGEIEEAHFMNSAP